MKNFTKWNIRTAIFFGIMILMLFITGQIKIDFWNLVMTYLIGTFSLGTFMWLVEDKYFPFRRKKILKKILRIFEAEPVSDSQAKFKIGNYNIGSRSVIKNKAGFQEKLEAVKASMGGAQASA